MEVFILGSSASVPTTKRNLPCLAFRIDGDVVLFDCGEGSQKQMMIYKISYSKVRAIFISHLHLDHFLGIFGLVETIRLNGGKDKIQVFGPIGLKKVLNSFKKQEALEIIEIAPNTSNLKTPIFSLNNHDVFSFDVSHGATQSLGYVLREKNKIRFFEKKAKDSGVCAELFSKILKNKKLTINKKHIFLKDISYVQKGKSVCYCGDTIFSKSCIKAAKNCDLLIHECTYDDSYKLLAKERFHSTASDCANVAKLSNSKSLLLTHISAKYSKDSDILLSQATKIFKNTKIAYDGLKIKIK